MPQFPQHNRPKPEDFPKELNDLVGVVSKLIESVERVMNNGLAFGDKGTSCEAGWAYEYGKGRVCFMSPGHMIVNLWNPEYVKLQQNAVRWLLRKS